MNSIHRSPEKRSSALLIGIAGLALGLIGCGGGGGSSPVTGSKVLFVSTESGTSQIYSSNLDGSGKKTIIDSLVADTDLVSAPGTGQLYFLRTDGANTDVFCTNLFGTSLTQITSDGGPKTDLQINAQGTKLIFVSGNFGTQNLEILNATGSNRQVLLANATSVLKPRFSPNGFNILYLKLSTQFNIFTINATGGSEFQVTNSPTNIDEASFHPDGNSILYSRVDGADREVFRIQANGSAETNLTNDDFDNSNPVFINAGQQIAYAQFSSGDDEIVIMNADGTNKIVVTDNGVDDNKPVLSADGLKLIWTRGLAPNTSIVIADATGQNQMPIHFNTGTKSSYSIP